MAKFKTSIIIDKPIDEVIQAYLEPKNIPYWMTNVVNYEVIEGKMGEIGTIIRLHYNQSGQNIIIEDRLIYCEKGKKYVSERASKTLIVQLETTFYPLKNATKMNLVWSGKGKVFILKLLLPLMRKNLRKLAKSELIRFRNMVESFGIDFSELSEEEI